MPYLNGVLVSHEMTLAVLRTGSEQSKGWLQIEVDVDPTTEGGYKAWNANLCGSLDKNKWSIPRYDGPQMWKKLRGNNVHKELVPRYDDPFKVIKRIGKVAYCLKLPNRLKIHPNSHVSFLTFLTGLT